MWQARAQKQEVVSWKFAEGQELWHHSRGLHGELDQYMEAKWEPGVREAVE